MHMHRFTKQTVQNLFNKHAGANRIRLHEDKFLPAQASVTLLLLLSIIYLARETFLSNMTHK